MFHCDKCKKVSKSGEKQTLVTVETRPATYYDDRRDPDRVTGQGFETVKEIKVCEKCVENKEI